MEFNDRNKVCTNKQLHDNKERTKTKYRSVLKYSRRRYKLFTRTMASGV